MSDPEFRDSLLQAVHEAMLEVDKILASLRGESPIKEENQSAHDNS